MCLQLCLVGHEALELLLDGCQRVGADLAHGHLEVAVALALELALDVLDGLTRKDGVDGHEVVDAVLALGVLHAGVGVGDGALELTDDGVAVIQNVDNGVGVLVGLAHLLGGVSQRHDLGTALSHDGFGNGEGVGVDGVEAGGDVAAKLHVLLLVDAHGDYIGLVEQDVGGHQHGISEESGINVVGVLLGLILELGHAGELTEAGEAVEQPCQLGMLLDVGLDVEGVLLGVKTAGHVEGEGLVGAAAKVGGHLTDGDGMLVHHAVEALILLGVGREILDGTKVVADGQVSAGLDAGEGNGGVLEHRVYPHFT